MAEIPVEKKSSMAWLWILLALLLLGLLLWWLLGNDDDADVAVVDDPIEAVENSSALTVGETLDMENVRVTRLSGDMAFYVDYQGNEVPVIFDEVQTPGTPTEGRYDINEGNMVNVTGEVRSGTTDLPEGADPSFLAASENYVYATDVQPVS